ncbi:AhpC/TSA family protein [Oceanicola granulosus HTCC2516]|uniref:Glutathione-dependent peroxiredoxin n=1 Tax=Oceanicola granulosus (strain ATCC BAA-861 / DSM 15982 / KCTC 12143 / HTCC2516) TaxID=314256 RepID=Q2CAL3_OCEGH|nr:peroxiredoxin [Oceanicola granulosus]EAR49700.1 AhpC/TSA family protein [Oceanicola granulosus HTCC2516]
MALTTGDTLPDATLLRIGNDGPETVDLGAMLAGRKVVIFGLPGAYTGTCTSAHVPSFIRSMDALGAKGVDAVVCTAVNDPFVMKAWGESTGAAEAGIEMLADASGQFAKAIGLDFDNPAVGFYGRSKRYALMAEDGVVKVLNVEDSPGVCDMSGGETMVDAL